jgi:hypothetical protein
LECAFISVAEVAEMTLKCKSIGKWDLAKEERLLEMWGEWSLSEIARELGFSDGRSVTRRH